MGSEMSEKVEPSIGDDILILLVEDNVTERKIITRYLSDLNYPAPLLADTGKTGSAAG